jgi:hypothetical protein
MLLLLMALQGAQAPADTVLAAARRAVAGLDDTAAVRAAGYRPIGEMGIPDGLPFQGLHWMINPGDTLRDVPLARPQFIMFGQVKGALTRVGVAYAAQVRLDEPPVVGLGGDPAAAWHDHFWCDSVPEAPRGFLVNDRTGCTSRGGTLAPRRTTMVHVWTDVSNPEGIYGHDNPALPFAALGLRPPTAHDIHDPVQSRAVRALALALAETYDVRLPVARRVERENTNAALADSVSRRRAGIASLIPSLRESETAGDRAAYHGAATRIIAEWEALLELYGSMAATPGLRSRVRARYEEMLTVSVHH